MSWDVVAWRAAAWDTPLWVGPNSRVGRYNRADSPATQYLCLHPWGPWAELLRWAGRDTAGVSTRLWAVRVSLPRRPRRLESSGDELVDDDHSHCRDLADEARASGEAGLIVPSAALLGTDNLVLFGPAVAVAWTVTPIDDIDLPCAVLADHAAPPTGLAEHVRPRGRHASARAPIVTAPVDLPA